jgi:mannan endo-1,4-beta-mannosidase
MIFCVQIGKVLSGQFAGYSPDTFNTQQVELIAQQTGQTPAILGCDWACGWNYKTPPENIIDYSCNPALKAHWSKGGFVTVNMHLPNPSSSNGGGYKDRGNLNFADLLNINSETGKRWYRFLDRMAEGLSDLQRAGVTVLFRPFHEMNGDWFYWCNQVSVVLCSIKMRLPPVSSGCGNIQKYLEKHVQLLDHQQTVAQCPLGIFT